MKILIADDDPDVRGYLAEVLSGAGHQVVEAEDGREALRRYNVEPVDLVLTDLCMPEKEGLETMRALREQSRRLKVIVISGAFQAGFLWRKYSGQMPSCLSRAIPTTSGAPSRDFSRARLSSMD